MMLNGKGMRGLQGLGMPAGYAAVGYCPGTNLPNYVKKPDGSYVCMTDAEIMGLTTFVTPGAPPAAPVASFKTLTPDVPILLSPPAPDTITTPASTFDPASFLKEYGWWIAGGVGAVALVMMMGK